MSMSKPTPPKPPPPPPEMADKAVIEAGQRERRRGVLSRTIMTSPQGLAGSSAQTTGKALLGQ